MEKELDIKEVAKLSFLDGKGMGEEAKRFVKKCMEEQFGTNSRGKA